MRLGLVAAASQRQGKRPTQEDRVRMAPDLALALMGKVSAVDPRPYLLIFNQNPTKLSGATRTRSTFYCFILAVVC